MSANTSTRSAPIARLLFDLQHAQVDQSRPGRGTKAHKINNIMHLVYGWVNFDSWESSVDSVLPFLAQES